MRNDVEEVVMKKPLKAKQTVSAKQTLVSSSLSSIEELIFETPDINQAVVHRLKKLIATGQYKCSEFDIAKKMLASLHT